MAEITVIVPVYKVEKYINRCVNSILDQTFTDFELILVDDGSPDNCGKICDEYAANDSRVQVIHKQNGGLSEARNFGIYRAFENCVSEWITFIDSDDWVHPKYLEVLYNAVRENNATVSVCGFMRTKGEESEVSEDLMKSEMTNPEDFYVYHYSNAVVAWGKLYKKDDFKNIRYPVGKIYEDSFVTHKILFKYPEIAVAKGKMYYYFRNPTSIVHSPWSLRKYSEVESSEEKIKYFKENGFEMAYKYQIELTVLFAAAQSHKVMKTPKYWSYLNFYLKKLRKYKRLAKKEGVMKIICRDPGRYRAVYPIRGRLLKLFLHKK